MFLIELADSHNCTVSKRYIGSQKDSTQYKMILTANFIGHEWIQIRKGYSYALYERNIKKESNLDYYISDNRIIQCIYGKL